MNSNVNAPLNNNSGDDTVMNKWNFYVRNLRELVLARCPKANDPKEPNVSEAARQIGIPQPTLFRILKGDHNEAPKHETLAKVEIWTKYTTTQLQQPHLLIEGGVSRPLVLWVPLLTFEHACNWRKNVDLVETGGLPELVPTTTKVGPYGFALIVTGDSMEPKFPAGTMLIIDPEVKPVSGNYVIAQLDGSGETIFKQLVVDGSRWYLRSLNPAYLPIQIDKNTVMCGRVMKYELDL